MRECDQQRSMRSQIMAKRRGLLLGMMCVPVIFLLGCGPRLPNDLPSLMRLMESNDETTGVDASNKVSTQFGKDGLLRVLRDGDLRARARAARWLWRFN